MALAVKALPSGVVHTALFIKNDRGPAADLLCFDGKTGIHGSGSLFHRPHKAQCSSASIPAGKRGYIREPFKEKN